MSLMEFCRLCGTLLLSKRVKMFHIMPETLRLKIFTIIPYNISMDDKLPKDCCYKCIDTLKEFVSFVDKSWTIQKTFFRRATLELKEASTEETSNLPYPTNWYEDNSPNIPNISIGVGNKTRPADKEEKQNKESEKQKKVLEEQNKASQEENKESEEQNKASQEENKESEEQSKESEKQSKESEKQSKESEKQSKESEKQSKESEEQNKDSEAGQSANRNDNGRKKSEEKDRDKSPDRLDNDVSISRNKLAEEPNAESDDNVSIVSSVRSSQDENHMKKKRKWNQRNPFCKPSKYKKRGKGGWRGGGRKRQTEAEKLVADNIEHYGGEPAPSCSSFLQLFVDGELTSVERKQSDFKSSSFIMSCIPGFGIVYACTKCDVIFTSETPAMVHECDGGYNPAASIASTELTGKGSQYMCQMCDQSFPRRVALESHLASHLLSDVTDDEAPPVKSRRRRRSSSDLELKLYKRREWSSDEVARKKARFRRKHIRDSDHSDVDIVGSSSSDSDMSSALDSDNFIVDDDVVEYDDDFIVHDEEEINRRRLKSKKKQKQKKRSSSSGRRAKYLFF